MSSAFTATFRWTEQRTRAAVALAEGKTQAEVAAEVETTDRTLRNWLMEPEFAEEVDRLSVMIESASRAARLRITNRVIRNKTKGEVPETEKDLLEWLKYAQSETDGIRLDLSKLALDHASDGRHDRQLPTTSLPEIQTSVAHTGPDTGDSAGTTTPATDLEC